MATMNERLSAASGRAVVAYPFMVIALAVIVGMEAADRSDGGFVGWALWALLWITVSAFAAGFVVLPILAAELLLWSFVEDRFPWLRDTWPGATLSSLVVAVPWAVAPQAGPTGGALIALGLVLARLAVPILRPGRAGAGA